LITIIIADVNPYSPSLQYITLRICYDSDAELSNVHQTATKIIQENIMNG